MIRSVTLILFVLFGGIVFSQKKIKKGIEWNDSLKIKKYISKGEQLDVLIPVTNKDGEEKLLNPISYAHNYKKYEALTFLLDHLDEFEQSEHYLNEVFIHSLSRKEEDSLSQVLFNKGIEINDSCSLCHGNNAIMVAAAAGNEKWYFDLKPQSELSWKNANGATLVHAAANSPNDKIIKDILAIEGMDPNVKDNEGLTPLDYAIWNYDNLDAFDMILDAGGDFRQAWHLALKYGYNPNPEVGQFAYNIVKENSDIIFEQNEDDMNVLEFVAFPYESQITGDQMPLCYNILTEMIYQMDSLETTTYSNEFLGGKDVTYYITLISSVENIESDEYMHLFRTYVEFIGLSIQKGYKSPFTKKDYKFATKCFGKEQVAEWFAKYKVPFPT